MSDQAIRTAKHATIVEAHPYHRYVSDDRPRGHAIVERAYDPRCPRCREEEGIEANDHFPFSVARCRSHLENGGARMVLMAKRKARKAWKLSRARKTKAKASTKKLEVNEGRRAFIRGAVTTAALGYLVNQLPPLQEVANLLPTPTTKHVVAPASIPVEAVVGDTLTVTEALSVQVVERAEVTAVDSPGATEA